MQELKDLVVEVLKTNKNEQVSYETLRKRIIETVRAAAKKKKGSKAALPSHEDLSTALCQLERERVVRSRLRPLRYRALGEERVYWLA